MVIIGTWNLENLFRPGGEAGPRTDEAYEAKLVALADTIGEVAPDVLAVQEVGDPGALDDLVSRLDGRWHTRLAEPDDRGIRVGFLSRFELTGVEQVTRFADGLPPVVVDDDGETVDRMGRAALRVRVAAEGLDVTLVCCHLKSKLLTYPGGRFTPRDEGERARYGVYALNRRAAEAATVRADASGVLGGQGERTALVVLGDLNDGSHAATTTLLYGPPGSEIGTPGFERPDRGDGDRLWNLAPLIPAEDRYSRTYQSRRELIDHILVSHVLLDRVEDVRAGDTGAGSVGDNPAERRDATASDHRPVLATLTTD
ncbi:MAG: endonuclease [Actinophytocola sp.]|nr:endonuclease [Actinophytocola sp.]